MKKRLAMIAAAAMLAMMLAACGSSVDADAQTTQDTGSATTAAQTDEASTDDTAEPSDGTLGSYAVEIKGAKLCKDYEGNNAIMITYSWTNNSDETTSPMGSMMEEAFQDGVQLDAAIVDFEYNDGLTDVRPGTTIDVDVIYELPGDSTVEFEISAIEDALESNVPKVTANFEPSKLSE